MSGVTELVAPLSIKATAIEDVTGEKLTILFTLEMPDGGTSSDS